MMGPNTLPEAMRSRIMRTPSSPSGKILPRKKRRKIAE
jgi:hypothetical protein